MVREHKIEIQAQACIGCGLCAKDCPADNLVIADKKAYIKSQGCIKCGHCVAICPKVLTTTYQHTKHLPAYIWQEGAFHTQYAIDIIEKEREAIVFALKTGQ